MAKKQVTTDFDRLPPSDVRAEMALLGALALAGADGAAFAQVAAMVAPSDFYQPDHQVIYAAMVDLHRRGRPIDAVTLRDELSSRTVLEEVGGIAYPAQIIGTVPSAAHAPHYAGIVRRHAQRRGGLALCNAYVAAAYAPHFGGDEEVVRELSDLAANVARLAAGGKANEVHRIDAVAAEVVARRQAGDVRHVPTRIGELDKVIGGFPRGGKTIVGAKAGMGKSAAIKQAGRNIAGAGTAFGLISVEETRHKVATNVIANESQVPNNRIAFGTAAEHEWHEIDQAVKRLADLPFYVCDSARQLSQIIAMAHVLACQYGCRVIAVDHVHIVGVEADREGNREREISRLSAELKWLWKDLDVCGVEAAQLNRKSGRDRPGLDSLRDSGTLEQDADVVILLHREDYYRKAEAQTNVAPYTPDHVLEALVMKNKSGATGVVPLFFDEARQSVRDLEPGDADFPV